MSVVMSVVMSVRTSVRIFVVTTIDNFRLLNTLSFLSRRISTYALSSVRTSIDNFRVLNTLSSLSCRILSRNFNYRFLT